MQLLGPTRHPRLNEAGAFVFLFASIFFSLSLASYHPSDPSFNTVSGASVPKNLIGYPGAYISDLCIQFFGLAAFVFPALLVALAWRWLRSRDIEAQGVKVTGAILLLLSLCTASSFVPRWRVFDDVIAPGGVAGTLAAEYLITSMNLIGAVLFTALCLIVSIYLVSTFSMAKLAHWLEPLRLWVSARHENWRRRRAERRRKKAEERAAARKRRIPSPSVPPSVAAPARELSASGSPPFDVKQDEEPEDAEDLDDEEQGEIPIRALEEPVTSAEYRPITGTAGPERRPSKSAAMVRKVFDLPPTALLNEPPARNAYDSQELKDIAARIKSKFEEFNVLGSVVQINPGPVVTTFEFKPEAGIKYSRITTLTEDLCLGLQAESILIERIPGKPTVGIEVPNTKREVISLRQVLESDDFQNSHSRLTVPLGKDASGRIKAAALESMPHLLIAGSTGSGKSVMLNSLIMAVLYKATPEEVRMILVDPKRVELGIYDGIPHLLTPVITDPKKATNALRNAVIEMERRLKLLAARGVRNLEQYNRKIRELESSPRSLFEGDDPAEEPLESLPQILIIIDELADLMMVERGSVEESITRLAQMARAVGMHLVVATQRPSVDVITGLIKANFPARLSFRVATRVDSRTILDVMGAEHLLGKGDMLFLPPGSSRLLRVHGAFVTETEIHRVVDFWKEQASPDYDASFLIAPPSDEDLEGEGEEFDGEQDPVYEEAVRVVVEMGKASTSTLQRRLRLGYGRAARILDMMQRDGIIGPPDGSRPRDVLKRPDWLREVQDQLR
jgi:S-DNA-T family DNA segregation ATPase FtsK/SpoIIIE